MLETGRTRSRWSATAPAIMRGLRMERACCTSGPWSPGDDREDLELVKQAELPLSYRGDAARASRLTFNDGLDMGPVRVRRLGSHWRRPAVAFTQGVGGVEDKQGRSRRRGGGRLASMAASATTRQPGRRTSRSARRRISMSWTAGSAPRATRRIPGRCESCLGRAEVGRRRASGGEVSEMAG